MFAVSLQDMPGGIVQGDGRTIDHDDGYTGVGKDLEIDPEINPHSPRPFGGPAPAHLLADCWAGKARPRELQGSVEASRRDASNDTIYLIGPLSR